jgi:hypothetical protein
MTFEVVRYCRPVVQVGVRNATYGESGNSSQQCALLYLGSLLVGILRAHSTAFLALLQPLFWVPGIHQLCLRQQSSGTKVTHAILPGESWSFKHHRFYEYVRLGSAGNSGGRAVAK